MEFTNYCVYETITKTKGYLTSYCDTCGNLWIASCDSNNISIYSIYENKFVKNKILNCTAQKCLFFELCDKLYIALISDKTLFIYEYLSEDLYDKQEFENCIANIKFVENNIYIVCNAELIIYDIANKITKNMNLKISSYFDVIQDNNNFYFAYWIDNKIFIYKNFEFYKNFNLKPQTDLKFYKNNNLYLLASDKNNLKIFEIESEKNNYVMLHLFENKINNFDVKICITGKCYINVNVDNNLYILENYEKELIVINKLKIKKETDYISNFDFDGNYYIIIENLLKNKTEYNNEIDKTINTHLKFVEFYGNNSDFDFYVDISFDNKNKLETEFAKMFSFYFEKLTDFLEKEDVDKDEKSIMKKILNNNLMINKLYYDKKFIVYKNSKNMIIVKDNELLCNNRIYKLNDYYDEIIKNIFIMDNKFHCVVKNKGEILYLPYGLDYNENVIVKSLDKIKLFCCEKNIMLHEETFDAKTGKIYKNKEYEIKQQKIIYDNINFDLSQTINTFVVGFTCCDDNFPKYYKFDNNDALTIRIKNKNYCFNDIKHDELDKIYIILDLDKEKIKNKNRREMIEWIDKTNIFDEFFITRLVCENKNGDIFNKEIKFNPFDLNMIFYNKLNSSINIVIDIFSTEKINFVLPRKNILCSKVIDTTTIKIINFLTKKEYFENEIKDFYENLN